MSPRDSSSISIFNAMISGKKFILAATLLILLFSGIYVTLVYSQLGAGVKAEWWLKNVYDFKDHLASKTVSPKIIILSGSNALFGINSSIVSDRTGYPVVNLSGHAGLDLNFLYIKLKKHIRDGDIVVMPLEFGYYQQSKISDWFANNIMAWGKSHYLDQLDYFNLFEFITSVPKARIYEGVLNLSKKSPFLEKSKAVERLQSLLQNDAMAWRGYSYNSLNEHGDVISGDQTTKRILAMSKRGFHYYGGWDISPRFIKLFQKIQALVENTNGKLILTWSVMMKNPLFDLSKPQPQKRLIKIQQNLAKHAITISCDPQDFQFPPEFFFDTQYHLNKTGTEIRSKKLAECITTNLNAHLVQNTHLR